MNAPPSARGGEQGSHLRFGETLLGKIQIRGPRTVRNKKKHAATRRRKQGRLRDNDHLQKYCAI